MQQKSKYGRNKNRGGDVQVPIEWENTKAMKKNTVMGVVFHINLLQKLWKIKSNHASSLLKLFALSFVLQKYQTETFGATVELGSDFRPNQILEALLPETQLCWRRWTIQSLSIW
jgi:hypothetical protein